MLNQADRVIRLKLPKNKLYALNFRQHAQGITFLHFLYQALQINDVISQLAAHKLRALQTDEGQLIISSGSVGPGKRSLYLSENLKDVKLRTHLECICSLRDFLKSDISYYYMTLEPGAFAPFDVDCRSVAGDFPYCQEQIHKLKGA